MLSTSLPLDSIWGPNCIICWVDILLDSKRATTRYILPSYLLLPYIHTYGPDHLLSMIDIIDPDWKLVKKLWGRSKLGTYLICSIPLLIIGSSRWSEPYEGLGMMGRTWRSARDFRWMDRKCQKKYSRVSSKLFYMLFASLFLER